ncbi:MAG: cytidylyltransferase domain-containing protein [Opitutales bacterium]
MNCLAMIPARMGSQRLARKNLRALDGVPLITRAIRKCQQAACFDSIWVNSEDRAFAAIAEAEGVHFHLRPDALGSHTATSEDYIAEFLQAHPCDWIVQVHSIAPLLTVAEVQGFVDTCRHTQADVLLSAEHIQIECALAGNPINFSFAEKTNSQALEPVQRISWSITAWRRECFLRAKENDQCATYAGQVALVEVSPLAGHVIKTERDLEIAERLLALVESPKVPAAGSRP